MSPLTYIIYLAKIISLNFRIILQFLILFYTGNTEPAAAQTRETINDENVIDTSISSE